MAATPNVCAYASKPPPPPPGVQKPYNSYDGSAVTSLAARCRREVMLDKSILALRAAAAIFSFVALILVASCRHGDWMEFGRYQEYRYLLGTSLVTFVYSAAQTLRHASRLGRGGDAHAGGSGSVVDFAGDQVFAYLLISALSAALPITNRMRSAVVNNFTDAIAAAIGLAGFAFAALAMSAIVSGCKLSS